MKLGSIATILDFNPFETRTEAEATHNLGEAVYLDDGRVFRYAKAGASNISVGKLQLAPAPIANHKNMACAAASANAFEVTVTPGATAGSANIYAEGFLVINDVDGEGQTYKVKSHAAITASTAFVVKLFDPIATALTANSEATLVHNVWNAVVEGTTQTTLPAGVPLVSISTGDYGWLQTRGVAAVLADETIAVGAEVTTGSSTAGAVETKDAYAEVEVGWALVAGVDTEYRPVWLTID